MTKENKKPFEIVREPIAAGYGYIKVIVWGRMALMKIYNNHDQERALMNDLERIRGLVNLMIEVK
jgi:hypothetical protein